MQKIKEFEKMSELYAHVIQTKPFLEFPETTETNKAAEDLQQFMKNCENPEKALKGKELADHVEDLLSETYAAAEERGFIIGYAYAIQILKEINII